MDYVTLAIQLLGGTLGALVAAALPGGVSLGSFGNAIVGCVGGSVGGLVLTGYLALGPAALADGTIAEPAAVLAQVLSGAAGGAILVIIVGLLKGLVRS